MKIYTQNTSFYADKLTPVGLYLSLRHHHRSPIILESNDYSDRSKSKSFIGLNPLIDILVFADSIQMQTNDQTQSIPIATPHTIPAELDRLIASFQFQQQDAHNGFLSYFSFEYAHLVETSIAVQTDQTTPLARFTLFRDLIVLDRFRETGLLIHNSFTPNENCKPDINHFLKTTSNSTLPFKIRGVEYSKTSETDFLELVQKAKYHIYRGDVFQLVVSRKFKQAFFGDDFEVYRQLRRLNPSPYLFYLDMEAYRIFGSSPEVQLGIKQGTAEIHPIAGTIQRTGNPEEEAVNIEQLKTDEKENAEHTMLVDLARNDLSKHCSSVRIEALKSIQQFSHVIHMTSKVIGKTEDSPLAVFNGTFPAGTLSGTPKPRALQLLQQYEAELRGFYGGAIGFLHTNGDLNTAIIIRSAFSQNNILHYQAGAGVVMDSFPEKELAEVDHKLSAMRRAIHQANHILVCK